jgi:hypothetical protein
MSCLAQESILMKKKKKTEKKSIRFESFATINYYSFSDDKEEKNGEGKQEQVAGEKTPSGKKNKVFDTNYNSWYTVKELRSFKADVWITIHWIALNNNGANTTNTGDNNNNKNNFGKLLKEKKNTNGENILKNKMGSKKYNEYIFCSRGIECRTPIGSHLKNKRRLDALNAVIFYQKVQQEQQHQLLLLTSSSSDSSLETRSLESSSYIYDNNDKEGEDSLLQPQEQEQEQYRGRRLTQIEIIEDTNILAKVYSSYCKDSRHEAIHIAQKDAKEVVGYGRLSVAVKSEATKMNKKSGQKMQPQKKKFVVVVLPDRSLCDNDDDDDDDDDDATFLSAISVTSDTTSTSTTIKINYNNSSSSSSSITTSTSTTSSSSSSNNNDKEVVTDVADVEEEEEEETTQIKVEVELIDNNPSIGDLLLSPAINHCIDEEEDDEDKIPPLLSPANKHGIDDDDDDEEDDDHSDNDEYNDIPDNFPFQQPSKSPYTTYCSASPPRSKSQSSSSLGRSIELLFDLVGARTTTTTTNTSHTSSSASFLSKVSCVSLATDSPKKL